MSKTNDTVALFGKVVRLVMFGILIYSSIALLNQLPYIAYAGAMVLILCVVGYKMVKETETVSFRLLVLNFLSVQLCTFILLSDLSLWSSFYGLEIVLSVFAGIIAWLVVDIIGVTILGSVLYGSLSRFSDELQKRNASKQPDPYGDKHAQRILIQEE